MNALESLPLADRDQMIAEVMQFLLDRGYTITAPGQLPQVARPGGE